MCERFAQVWDEELGWYVRRWIGPDDEAVTTAIRRDPGKDFNVAPTDPVGVVVESDGGLALQWMRWGFPLKQLVINTRLEAVLRSRVWRPLMEHRAAIPMTGFYEWAADDGQPHFFHRHDGKPMMVAAVHGVRRAGHRTSPCVSLLTCPANADLANIQGRMPLVLAPDDVPGWLDPRVDAEAAVGLIAAPPAGTLAHYAVTREVQRGEARGPGLVAPVEMR